MKLSMEPEAEPTDGLPHGTSTLRVLGMPDKQKAFIEAEFGEFYFARFKPGNLRLRSKRNYPTAEAALAALQADVDRDSPKTCRT